MNMPNRELEILTDAEHAATLRHFGLSVNERKPGVFSAYENDIKNFRKACHWMFLPVGDTLQNNEVSNREFVGHTDNDRTRNREKGREEVFDLNQSFLSNYFFLTGEKIRALLEKHRDLPIHEVRSGEFHASSIKLGSWMSRNPGIINVSDLHFHATGHAI
jgi:hypothetical protein